MCEIRENIIRVIADGKVVEKYHEDYVTFSRGHLAECKKKYVDFEVHDCTLHVNEIVEFKSTGRSSK